jgi:hemerythrin superfamily protein
LGWISFGFGQLKQQAKAAVGYFKKESKEKTISPTCCDMEESLQPLIFKIIQDCDEILKTEEEIIFPPVCSFEDKIKLSIESVESYDFENYSFSDDNSKSEKLKFFDEIR